MAEVIGQNLKNGASLKDHAVLYRMNAQSNPIETYFARAGIPYRIVGGQRFFDRKEVKDINSYMAVVVNPRDDVRLRRIINEPARKIGATTIDKIGELAAANGVPMMEIIREASSYPALGRAASALNAFYSMYRELCDLSVTLPLDEFAGEVIRKTGYEAMLKAQKEEGETRLENLGQLISSVKTYAEQNGEDATLSGFLEEVALIADLDSYDEDADAVTLMTMHSAKGLEFPYVFIIGMEDGVFPGDLARYSEEEMEEERRLCYVGITRAKASKMANEDARFVLPNACETKMVMTMNCRSLNNFFNLRCCNRAQWEIRAVADEMLRLVYPLAPHVFAAAGPRCLAGPCPEGGMCCGKQNAVRDKYATLKQEAENHG